MKLNKYFVVLSLSLSFINFYGMKREREEIPLARTGFIPASVKALFVPQDNVKNELFLLLDGARRQVLVAMYLITDDSIINKLISLKQRGIDVQMIIDESMQKNTDLVGFINKMQQVGIVPIVFPSEGIYNSMHNKFLVVDGSVVFTGSANFSQSAFTLGVKFYNHENIVILSSQDIAQKYVAAFREIERDAFSLYIRLVAGTDLNQLPQWMTNIVLPRYQDQLRPLAEAHLKNLTQNQQARLQTFFNLPLASPTPKQAKFLILEGYSPDISKQEASDLLEKLTKAPATAPTPGQVDILKEHNISIIGISKQDAIDLIGDIMRSRK